MGILSRYKEEHPELAKSEKGTDSRTNTPPLNLPVKCTGYDGEFILGVRLDTKEEIKIKLRPIDQNASSRFKRIEVEEFANPKSKHHAKPGFATFVAESCYHEKENVYNSRWVKIISEDQQKTAIYIVNASYVSIKKNDGETEVIFVKTSYPEKAKLVSSVDDLENTLAVMLQPKSIGSNPFVHVRITDINANEVEYFDVIPQKVEREDGLGKKCVEGATSAHNFINSDDSKMIRDLLTESPELISVEVIPAAVIYPGSATKDNMVNSHPNAKKVLEESFHIKSKEEVQTGGRPENGYLKCILATRKHADGTSYFTFIKPIHQYTEPMSVKNLK
jgi:hypothetical protein